MLTGRVIGTATSTLKHPSLQGWRLVVVQPLAGDGRTADGDPILAVDGFGAGRGETVILSSDRRNTQALLASGDTPVDWSVLGIAD